MNLKIQHHENETLRGMKIEENLFDAIENLNRNVSKLNEDQSQNKIIVTIVLG